MAVYVQSATAVLTALFVLAQLCSASTFAAQRTDVNKLKRPETGTFVQNGKLQNSSQTSNDDELRCRVNTGILHMLLSKRLRSKNAEGLRKRIVYPTAVDNSKNTLKFVVEVSEIIGRPIVVKLMLFHGRRGCPVRFEVKIVSSNSEKENSNCLDAIRKRFHGLLQGQYYESNDEKRISFDVSELIERVLRNLKEVCKTMDTAELTIKVKARTCSSPKDETQNPPYLEITPIPASTPLQCTPGETRCCIETKVMMLREILSNIFVPTRYRSGICKGRCEAGPLNGPCCVPTKTSPLSVLYFKEGIIKKTVLNDVVVEACGCR